MGDSVPRWVLGFDASCGACRQISDAVAEAGGGKLEVMPLAHPDVRQWRERSTGRDAAWEPTLLRVGDDSVRAWNGKSMAIVLARRLGIRSTLRLLRALGAVRQEAMAPTVEQANRAAMGRAEFLQFGAGAVVAAGIVLTGRTPVLAASTKAQTWAAANKDQLPRDYAEFVKYTEPYRKAIYQELAPGVRGRLWLEQFQRYRAAHPELTAAQADVIDRAVAIVSRESTFALARGPQEDERLIELASTAIAAFGKEDARALVAALGSVTDDAAAPLSCPTCTCNAGSNWCDVYCCGTPECYAGGVQTCACTSSGCGTLWSYPCNGLCYNAGCSGVPVCG